MNDDDSVCRCSTSPKDVEYKCFLQCNITFYDENLQHPTNSHLSNLSSYYDLTSLMLDKKRGAKVESGKKCMHDEAVLKSS
jgi:hypothetical protein